MQKKNNFQMFVLFAIEMAILSFFGGEKKGHGLLGVKNIEFQIFLKN